MARTSRQRSAEGKTSKPPQPQKTLRIKPSRSLATLQIPDTTPDVVLSHAPDKRQALLARVRYNGLVSIYTGMTCYSVQSRMHVTSPGAGETDVDEVYVGITKAGEHYAFSVRACADRRGLDAAELQRDIAVCGERFLSLTHRPLAALMIGDDVIAIIELVIQDGTVRVAGEKHYQLVPAAERS